MYIKEFEEELRNISIVESYYIQDDDCFNYRNGKEKRYKEKVIKLVKTATQELSIEECIKAAESIYNSNEFNELNVNFSTFKRIINSLN